MVEVEVMDGFSNDDGGSIVLRGRTGSDLTCAEKRQFTAVVDALLRDQ